MRPTFTIRGRNLFIPNPLRPDQCELPLNEDDTSSLSVVDEYTRLMKGLHPDTADTDEHTSARCAIVREAYRQAMEQGRTRR